MSRSCVLLTYGGVENSNARVEIVSLGMMVELWRVRAIVNSEWPRKTEDGCSILQAVEVVYNKQTRDSN